MREKTVTMVRITSSVVPYRRYAAIPACSFNPSEIRVRERERESGGVYHATGLLSFEHKSYLGPEQRSLASLGKFVGSRWIMHM